MAYLNAFTVGTWNTAGTGSAAAYAANKSMISIFNNQAATTVKVWRIWCMNNQTTAITGGLAQMQIQDITAHSGGTSLTPVAHDLTLASLPAGITVITGATVTETYPYIVRKRFYISNDEWVVAGLSMDEFWMIPTLNVVYDAGYGDTHIQPLTLVTGEGIHVKSTVSTVSTADLGIQFTVE